MGVPGILYKWFMPQWKAMEQRVEEEKDKNRQLMDRLANLEKQMAQAQAKDTTPESVPPQPPADTTSSKVEDLLSKAMTQIQSLEKKLDEQSKPTPEPDAKVCKKNRGQAKGSSAPSSPQDGDDESDGDSSDDECIVTPDGKKVS